MNYIHIVPTTSSCGAFQRGIQDVKRLSFCLRSMWIVYCSLRIIYLAPLPTLSPNHIVLLGAGLGFAISTFWANYFIRHRPHIIQSYHNVIWRAVCIIRRNMPPTSPANLPDFGRLA
jgi:hypothetical protein